MPFNWNVPFLMASLMDKAVRATTPISQVNMIAWRIIPCFPLKTSQCEDMPVIVKHVRPKTKNARSRARSFSVMSFEADVHNMDTIPRSACTYHTLWWLCRIFTRNQMLVHSS